MKLLISGGSLNAPWGMALAPNGFGTFSGALLVGNFGDGKINAYNISTGALMGVLNAPNGTALQFSGLWGIAFGNGSNNQPTTTLFYAAGVSSESGGVYGRIDYGTVNTGGGGAAATERGGLDQRGPASEKVRRPSLSGGPISCIAWVSC